MLCRSTLTAYVAVIGLCQMLGFSFLVYPFGCVVGFSDDTMLRSQLHSPILQAASASFMLHMVWSGCAISGIDMSLLAPVQSPVLVLGSVMLFFSMLIMSNFWFSSHKDLYIRSNIVFLVLTAASICIGKVCGMADMANTGTAFLVLWILEKYCELHVEPLIKGTHATRCCLAVLREWNSCLSVISGSLLLHFTALWLHAHPSFTVQDF